jgi:hypothetical protein
MSFTEDSGATGATGATGASRDPVAEDVAATPAGAAPAQQTPAERSAPAVEPDAPKSPAERRSAARRSGRGSNMLPERESRRFRVERLLVRFIATLGIVGIGVALGAILVSNKTQGWVTGLVIAIVSVVLSAILWSSKQM